MAVFGSAGEPHGTREEEVFQEPELFSGGSRTAPDDLRERGGGRRAVGGHGARRGGGGLVSSRVRANRVQSGGFAGFPRGVGSSQFGKLFRYAQAYLSASFGRGACCWRYVVPHQLAAVSPRPFVSQYKITTRLIKHEPFQSSITST